MMDRRGGSGGSGGPVSTCFSARASLSKASRELGFVGLLRMIDSVDVNSPVVVPPGRVGHQFKTMGDS